MKIQSRLKKAFSLVEVTLALGICSFCLVALVGVLPSGMMASSDANNRTGAADVAAAVLADLQGIGSYQPVDANGQPLLDQGGQPVPRVFPSLTPLYGVPCGPGNASSADGDTNLYNFQFGGYEAGTPPSFKWGKVATNGQYYVQVKISPKPNAAVSQPYKFVVTVSWPGATAGGKDGDLQLKTMTVFGKSAKL